MKKSWHFDLLEVLVYEPWYIKCVNTDILFEYGSCVSLFILWCLAPLAVLSYIGFIVGWLVFTDARVAAQEEGDKEASDASPLLSPPQLWLPCDWGGGNLPGTVWC